MNLDKAKILFVGLIFLLSLTFFTSALDEAATTSSSLSLCSSAIILDNPTLPQSCGLDIVLVLDSSGSIDDTELIQMKNAFKDFVDAFLPGTLTEFAVIDFDTGSTKLQPFTNNINDIKNAINTPVSGGWTNWNDALGDAQDYFNSDRTNKPDLIIFASDGNPNTININNPGKASEENAVEYAVQKANNLKQDGVRIVTLAIGDNLNTNNLKAISGPNIDTGDINVDVITTNFDTLAEDLADYANTLCGGKILIQNQIDKNGDGDASDIEDLDGTESNSELSNWNFEAGEKSGTTNNYGYLELSVDTGTYDVNEIVKSGYTLENAYCEKDQSNIGTFDGINSVNNIFINDEETVMCYFINYKEPVCGNGILEIGEECDDGSLNGILCNAGYEQFCEYCSDVCDLIQIQGPYCGDGEINGPEECEIGDTQACTTGEGYAGEQTCTSECGWGECETDESCGDGIINDAEECDDGILNGVACNPLYESSCTWCNNQCELIEEEGPYCGDGFTDNPFEECDSNESIQCSDSLGYLGFKTCQSDCTWSNCQTTEYCGDGIINDGEECDNGSQNGEICDNSKHDCEYCSSSCEIKEHKERKEKKDEDKEPLTCEPNWQCDGWGECVDGIMKRTCEDKNFCELDIEQESNKPLETMACQEGILLNQNAKQTSGINWLIIGIGILILLLVLIIIISVFW